MKVTDEMVLAACNAYEPRAAAPSLDYWGEEHAADMRRAVEAALSRAAAPEPEWEYGYELIEPDDRNVFERDGHFVSAVAAHTAAERRVHDERHPDVPTLQIAVIRRRKYGPWLPVGGEN